MPKASPNAAAASFKTNDCDSSRVTDIFLLFENEIIGVGKRTDCLVGYGMDFIRLYLKTFL